MAQSIDWEQDGQVLTSTFSPASSAADGTIHLGVLPGGLWTRHWLGLEVSGGLARQHRLLLQQRTGPTAPCSPFCWHRQHQRASEKGELPQQDRLRRALTECPRAQGSHKCTETSAWVPQAEEGIGLWVNSVRNSAMF